MPFQPGDKLGPYEITVEIGHGGMATVYKAHQSSMGRHVAIKVLPEQFLHDPTFLSRFTQEARVIAALANPDAQVFAFEPFPETHARLRQNATLNTAPRLEAICAAVGDVDGVERELYLTDGAGLPVSCSLSLPFMQYPDGIDQPASGEPLHSVRVPMITIDAFARERKLTSVDVVKIDTESTEPEVLRGMHHTLTTHRPHLIVEVLGHTRTEEQLTPLLEAYGYSFFHLTERGPIQRPAIRPAPPWDNYLVTMLSEGEVNRLWRHNGL
jgi:FkbM family methyltransferase